MEPDVSMGVGDVPIQNEMALNYKYSLLKLGRPSLETSQRTKVCNHPLLGDAALAWSVWKQ